MHEGESKTYHKRRKYWKRRQWSRLQRQQNEALALAANSSDSAHMHQKRASRDEATRSSENVDDAKLMIQHRVSRCGATCASENAAHA